MATVKFKASKPRGKTSIVARLNNGTKNGLKVDFKKTTPYTIMDGANWDNKKERVKDTIKEPSRVLINAKLNDLETFLHRKCNEDADKDIVMDKTWFKLLMQEFFSNSPTKQKHKIYLKDFFDKYHKDYIISPKGYNKAGLKSSTIRTYLGNAGVFEFFDIARDQKTTLVSIDQDWFNEFLQWVFDNEYSVSSIKSYVHYLVSVLGKGSIRYKITMPQDFRLFKAPKEYLNEGEDAPQDIFYSTEKLEKIAKYKGDPLLENARDWILISSLTGLRYSDWKGLDETKLKFNKDGSAHVFSKNIKTGKDVAIPVQPLLWEVLVRNNNGFPKVPHASLINKRVKELAKELGFNEVSYTKKSVSKMHPVLKVNKSTKVRGNFPFYEACVSHSGRRSFATNMIGLLPKSVIMAICGWSNEDMLRLYAKIDFMESIEAATEHSKKELAKAPANVIAAQKAVMDLHNRNYLKIAK